MTHQSINHGKYDFPSTIRAVLNQPKLDTFKETVVLQCNPVL